MSVATKDSIKIDPLFRWVGGKQRLVHLLTDYLPVDFDQRLYMEPFVGAGSLFFRTRPKRAVLADANTDLIHCYKQIRKNPELIARYLVSHAKNDAAAYYYKQRDIYNHAGWCAAQAARFIYINRTSFNGIYRVNTSGYYNVPYGYKTTPKFPSKIQLHQVSSALNHVSIQEGCFRKTLTNADNNSFVYADPPYPPLNGTSFFNHYTHDRFSDADQADLANKLIALDSCGTLFMLSNADTPYIRKLYKGYDFLRVRIPRWVSCKGTKHKVNELIIRNF